MFSSKLLTAAAFVLLPLVVAFFGLSVPSALLLVVVLLFVRWLGIMAALSGKSKAPEITLTSIGVSHFVEKVRWCLDRLGLDYQERRAAGTLGGFYLGRTVPVLKFRTGRVTSSIGNSPEILRYLWGRYAAERPEAAAFLEPTPERLELEGELDRYGRNLQIWIYYHLLPEKALLLRAWGADDPAVPAWQRRLIRLLHPVQVTMIRRAFGVSAKRYEKARQHIETLLEDLNARLGERSNSLLGDRALNYTDFCFAALSSPWLLPENLAGQGSAVLDFEELPAGMREDIERFKAAYPAVHKFVEQLYKNERGVTAGNSPGEI